MKILVTGAAGFLGRRIASIASAMGNEVLGLDLVGDHCILKCDLSKENEVSEVLSGIHFDAVIHLAGIRGNYRDMTRVNVRGTTNLLNALQGNSECVVLASSCAVYGIPRDPDGCIHDDDPAVPITDYGKTMLKKEKIAEEICSLRDIPLASARIFNLFGAEQSPGMMTSAVAQKLVGISRGKIRPPLQTGPLHTLRDLIDVNDVAEAMVQMAAQRISGKFNLGTGIPRSGTEVVDTFQDILEMQVPVEVNSEHNPMVECIYADISRVQSALGWEPLIPFRSTLVSIVNYWLKQD
ncbi:MAG: NAD(P)-dependent oxidoreductase [Candidatus Sabulitectum sp.]|nr:NAD(P)-dependent oxidoreductase [Candidatus Sabulitectum sp.]